MNISDDFTVDDIRKVREELFEREKKIGKEEMLKEIKEESEKFEKEIEEIRKKKHRAS